MIKLPADFYLGEDVLKISQDLLGKLLVTNFDGLLTSGRIVETEAYNGVLDKASHAFGGRRTKRTEVMFGEGGHAYVYLCYGIHYMFNVVTNVTDIPHAVLVRGIEPVDGRETMMARMHKTVFNKSIGRGPGNVARALGFHTMHTGKSLQSDEIYIVDDGFTPLPTEIVSSPRIGVAYAGEDAQLLYRYAIKGNAFVSGKPAK